ncbi:auxin response factor 18-like [Olea europaea var. sylvestris]|uniref:auxin response factor 18-like n=1 Tax=Olea europaea var. sylvestris TaxID=158386 RepID=UPI000C1D6220|nr:auxin response factor 18-like [Olea europaea var. sylvestris]XP_022846671.1 auxin response factor 18-like [Olea europaea var. sylvestris]
MRVFMEDKEKTKETERGLDSQLWHACAGSMVQMPPVNTKVLYFPQGHAEHACGNVDFRSCPRIPAYVPCRVSAIKFMADPENDEVFAKIQLVPVSGNDVDFDDEDVDGNSGSENTDKPASFAKTLTQSDANNGGGFSVPRYCAETLFPPLDYTADPPVQTILAKDVHGGTWKFRHIYRGTPRRHLLTTGWSAFVNHKKLVAGDSIVFLRAENGDLCVGIRRAKREIGAGHETSAGWNPACGNSFMPYGGFSSFLMESENKLVRKGNQNSSGNSTGRQRVKAESVIEAATLAATGQPFEVVYYPRASTPEFCVKASLVKMALQMQWYSGMRFKMAFETDDSSRVSWFMGTISTAQVVDPVHWPDSPWRLLQVTWDEPELLQNVRRINPWLVELVSNMSTIHLSPFSPPQKKLRLPQHPEFSLNGQYPLPAFLGGQLLGSGNLFGYLRDNTPAGMQGARQAQYGLSLSDFYLSKLQSNFFQTAISKGAFNPNTINPGNNKNVSCLQTIGNSVPTSKNSDNGKKTSFVLFGQPILTEQQISQSKSSSEGNSNKMENTSNGYGHTLHQHGTSERLSRGGFHPELDLEASHCKVFMEYEDVGRTVNLSLFGSYEELCKKLKSMFDIDSSGILNHVFYQDVTGAVRQLGDEPFSDFTKSTRRLRILMDTNNENVGM